jgi:pimeloyl-ACP methyl ester carboxylesterase
MRTVRSSVLVLALAALAAAVPAAATGATAKRLVVGGATLHRCADGDGWCGSVRRALDPADPSRRSIDVGFRWIPATAGATPGAPTIVAAEGGPGYPSTGSVDEYRGIYAPLLTHRNLLMVDGRGTGLSALIDCKPLQKFLGRTSDAAFAKLVGACAVQLEQRYGRGAADLFATAYDTDDMAAVLQRLGLGPVDLYGDSYGTWFVQSFLSRHAAQVHTVTLDSAYPVRDLDPWYASSGAAIRAAIDAVCARDAGCAAATKGQGTATDRLGRLLAVVRKHAISGVTRDAGGTPTDARVGPRQLVDLAQDAGSDPVVYRELDAAVRAALHGDRAPLLRLEAQSRAYDHGYEPASYYSDGAYFAVACVDYPQLFSMASSPAQRRVELAARLAHPPVGAFGPFTAREFASMSAYSEPYSACLDWPAPTHVAPVIAPGATPLPASIPVLVLGGDLDSLTPLSDVLRFAPGLGANVRVVTLRNSVHVTSEGDTMLNDGKRCARQIVRRFVAAPASLQTLDARCAAAIPPVHTPGGFPTRLARAAAAHGFGPRYVRRAVTVAAGAAADATVRRFYSGVAHGPGLRGGTFTTRGEERVRLHLRRIRFVRDATVTGTAVWRPETGAVRAVLTVRSPGHGAVHVTVAWRQRDAHARAHVGHAEFSLPAP